MNRFSSSANLMAQGYPGGAPAPQKKGMSGCTMLLVALGALTAVGLGSCVLFGAAVGGAANEVAEQGKKEAVATKARAAQCDSATARPWATIAKELKENEARVAKSWKGACQKVTGVVSSIDSGIDDKPVVHVGSGKQFEFQNLHCKPADEIGPAFRADKRLAMRGFVLCARRTSTFSMYSSRVSSSTTPTSNRTSATKLNVGAGALWRSGRSTFGSVA